MGEEVQELPVGKGRAPPRRLAGQSCHQLVREAWQGVDLGWIGSSSAPVNAGRCCGRGGGDRCAMGARASS